VRNTYALQNVNLIRRKDFDFAKCRQNTYRYLPTTTGKEHNVETGKPLRSIRQSYSYSGGSEVAERTSGIA